MFVPVAKTGRRQAVMVADPSQMTARKLDAWAADAGARRPQAMETDHAGARASAADRTAEYGYK